MISREAYVWTFLSRQIASHLNVLTGSVIPRGQARLSVVGLQHCPVVKIQSVRVSLTTWALTICIFWTIFSIVMHIFPVNTWMLSSHISSLSHRRCFPLQLDSWQLTSQIKCCLQSFSHFILFHAPKSQEYAYEHTLTGPWCILAIWPIMAACHISLFALCRSCNSVTGFCLLDPLDTSGSKRQRSSEGPWVCPTYITGNWRKPHCGPKQPCHGLESNASASETELWPSHFSPGPRFMFVKRNRWKPP